VLQIPIITTEHGEDGWRNTTGNLNTRREPAKMDTAYSSPTSLLGTPTEAAGTCISLKYFLLTIFCIGHLVPVGVKSTTSEFPTLWRRCFTEMQG